MVRASRVADGLRDQGRRTPSRTAVRDATGSCTFAELDALVATLARRLRATGAEHPDDSAPVPLLLRRDRWSVVALHAAFRAGVACAPLDADLPPAVLADLVARLGHPRRAVVADAAAAAGLPPGVDALVVPRAPDRPVADGRPVGPVDPVPVRADAPAVVVFTSGSTGRPKGVVLPWSAFDETPPHYLGTVAPGEPAARIGVTAPLHWVGGLRRVLALSGGASVSIMATPAGDPGDLLEWLAAERVTQCALGPALAAQLDGVWPATRRLELVDLVILGGDVATGAHVETLRRIAGPHAVVRYAYSATEVAGVNILCRSYRPDDPVPAGPLPLGYEAAPGRVRFEPVEADDRADLVEVVARGVLASGYLDDPDRTDAQFGVDPDGTPWWRTGDLVRLDADGCAWHAGRLDDTVKINGKLVAPAESEMLLRGLGGVRHVAVVPQRGDRRTRLVAHLQVDPAAGLTPEAVRAHCAERLAPHVVPGVLARHDRLPTAVTGKTDRARLAREPVHPWRTAPARPAGTDPERWLLTEVRRVLELDDVGPDDELLAVGLDSLAAVELCAAIADAGYGEIGPAQVYAAGSVAGLVRTLGVPDGDPHSTVVAIHPDGSRIPLVGLPGGGGTAVRFRFLGEALGPDRPLLVVEPRGLHRRGRPDRSVEALAAHACAEVTARLAPGTPVAVMGYSASGPVAYETAARLHAAGRPVHLVLLDTAPSLVALWEVDAAPTVRTAARPQLGRALARSLGYRIRHPVAVVERWRLERFPGRARFDVERYRAFQRIMVRAGRAYVPAPAGFAATLLHVDGAEVLVEPCARSIADLTVRVVGGDHGSMLEPPFVDDLARAVCGAVDAALGDGAP